MKKIRQLIFSIARRFSEDKVTVYGAQASFFLMVSLGPFSIALAAMIQFFLPGNQWETLQAVLEYVPEQVSQVARIGINEIFTSSAPSIISISIILAIWSASKGVLSLERCMHAIYRYDERHNYLFVRLRSMFYTLVLLIAIVFALAFLVFGNTIQAILAKHFPVFARLSVLIVALRALISICILIFAFSAIYEVLTGKKRRFTDVLPGVLFATIGWVLFSVIYAYYIANFSNYTVIYGALGAFTLFMLWMYFCILILLIGAEINVFLENHHSFFRSSTPSSRGTPRAPSKDSSESSSGD
ncbi:YihY/virulence factor BrkB family protein [Lachnospiraceae bacterium CLA-AA-H215]|uniref:YihY/virulence factor BrkB family protein n=1 Tax=Hominifimenecus microfluidus TaxID=2885348 RepID=A0AAE3ED27_9FIRM|nr:YihY/virulence factor BrkB family protein [Hominifimenecus microfluidus]MCC2231605.1 YihY/virulence factor BrkB family protein [Hominifimenecus microfluidus]